MKNQGFGANAGPLPPPPQQWSHLTLSTSQPSLNSLIHNSFPNQASMEIIAAAADDTTRVWNTQLSHNSIKLLNTYPIQAY